MIHEMEEIIGFKPWFDKNMALVKKYSMLEKLYDHFSTEGFAAAVLEEYFLCIILTGISIFSKIYLIWIGAFIAFTIHLVIHVLQSIFIRKAIPALITSILLLPIAVFLISVSINYCKYSYQNIIIASILFLILIVLNLFFAHKIMSMITQKAKNNN